MSSRRVGQVTSVNVGAPRQVRWHGRTVTTAIWKYPVDGRVPAVGVNIDGDDQADRRVHGGPTKAIYAYAVEDYQWWAEQLGSPLLAGTSGENLTVAGVDLRAAVVGERWHVGTTTVRVTEPRIPCFKLGIRMGDASFVDRFADAARPGTYLAIAGRATREER
jgi:MOSC domain-containing protein YiiM